MPECLKTKPFTGYLTTGCAVEVVSACHDGHSDNKFGDGAAVLPRGVFHNYSVCGSGLEVDVVVACTGTDNDLEFGSGGDNLVIDDIGPDDYGVDIGNGLGKLATIGVFLKYSHGVAGTFYYLADAVYGFGREGFLCCK